jgi:hypothetical protein
MEMYRMDLGKRVPPETSFERNYKPMRMQIKLLGLCAVILMAIGSASAQTCTVDQLPVSHDLLMGDGAGNMADSGVLAGNVPLLNATSNAFTGFLGATSLSATHISTGGITFNDGTTLSTAAGASVGGVNTLNGLFGANAPLYSGAPSVDIGSGANGGAGLNFNVSPTGVSAISFYRNAVRGDMPVGEIAMDTESNDIHIRSDGFVLAADFNHGGISVGSYAAVNPAPTSGLIVGGGNVGIGTPTPGAALEVNGNVILTIGSGSHVTFPDGSVQATAWNGTAPGGDYAESVDVIGGRQEYEPGDVMVIDSASPDKFLKSTEPYSTMVAGIYSTKPGLTGRRQKGTDAASREAEVPMALMGIVPTKVTAENGPIKPGDLMVASSTAGYAMKGTDRERLIGAVIGKAMGHLDAGTGVIEVLVSLQ